MPIFSFLKLFERNVVNYLSQIFKVDHWEMIGTSSNNLQWYLLFKSSFKIRKEFVFPKTINKSWKDYWAFKFIILVVEMKAKILQIFDVIIQRAPQMKLIFGCFMVGIFSPRE